MEKPLSLASGQRRSLPVETWFSEPSCSAHRAATPVAAQGTLAVSAARLPNLRSYSELFLMLE